MRSKLLLLGLLLQGCSYSDGCFYSPQMVSCVSYPDINKYQKRENIGHTDAELRWLDLEKCGGERTASGYFKNELNEKIEKNPEKHIKKYNELISEARKRKEEYRGISEYIGNYTREIYFCMISKGYIHFEDYKCREMNICR